MYYKNKFIKMYKIAKDAFATNDFCLATKLFERCIEETRNVEEFFKIPQNIQLQQYEDEDEDDEEHDDENLSKIIDLYFNYGDALARCGRMYEAFDIYSSIAGQIGDIPIDRLKHFCIGLLEYIRNSQIPSDLSLTPNRNTLVSVTVQSNKVQEFDQQHQCHLYLNGMSQSSHFDPLICLICEDVLKAPVTASCGHTFCRQCCIQAGQCPTCSVPFPIIITQISPSFLRHTQSFPNNHNNNNNNNNNHMEYDHMCDTSVSGRSDLDIVNNSSNGLGATSLGLKSDVLVRRLVEKWWSADLQARELNDEAVKYLDINSLDDALKCCNESLEKSPNNHKSLLLRAEVLYRLNHFQSSLADAENALKTRPASVKAYHRRALALSGLGRNDEALISQCLAAYLDCKMSYLSSTTFTNEMCRLLQRFFVSSRHRCSTSTTTSPYADVAKRKKKRRKPLHLAAQNFGTSDCDEANSSCGEDDLHHHRHHYQTLHNYPQNFYHNNRHSFRSQVIHKTRRYSKRTTCMTVDRTTSIPNGKLRNLLGRIHQEIQKIRRMQQKSTFQPNIPTQVDVSDFDCVLCCRTLWRPVITPCGHTYCWVCLDRSMDYSSLCPLCKSPLTEQYKTNHRGTVAASIPFSLGKKSVTKFLEAAMERFIPECYEKRHRQEIELEPSVPLFICTTAFPQVACPLFVYEPRYRLMVRRAIESGERQFGIVQPHTGISSYSDIGTMLEIRDCVQLGDGCSILSTVGCRRFRIISHDEKDGYETAKVEYIYDESIPESRLADVKTMHNYVYNKATRWFQSLSNDFKEEVLQSHGPMPDVEDDWPSIADGPAWAWWIIAILPLNQCLKVNILATTSLEKRLRAINKTLEIQKSKQRCVVVQREGLPTCQAIESCQQGATSSSTNDDQQTGNDTTEYML